MIIWLVFTKISVQCVTFAVFHDKMHVITVFVDIIQLDAILNLACGFLLNMWSNIISVIVDLLLDGYQVKNFLVDVFLRLPYCLDGVGHKHWIVENRNDLILLENCVVPWLRIQALFVCFRLLSFQMLHDFFFQYSFPNDTIWSHAKHLAQVKDLTDIYLTNGWDQKIDL